MKATATPKHKHNPTFPCLMIASNNKIIFVEGEKNGCYIGTCLLAGDGSQGNHSDHWAKSCFSLYDGEITLSN